MNGQYLGEGEFLMYFFFLLSLSQSQSPGEGLRLVLDKKNLPLNQNYSNRLFQTSFGEVQDSDLPLIK